MAKIEHHRFGTIRFNEACYNIRKFVIGRKHTPLIDEYAPEPTVRFIDREAIFRV